MIERGSTWLRRLSDHGMILVLLLLCVGFTLLTFRKHYPDDDDDVRQVAAEIHERFGASPRVLIVVGAKSEDAKFAAALKTALTQSGAHVLGIVKPAQVRAALAQRADVVAGNAQSVSLLEEGDLLGPASSVTPTAVSSGYWWPTFLQISNFRNIADQIAVIAIVAIGMTLVIITGGIDLSVGSQIGLAAVVTALLIRDRFGGIEANGAGMIVASIGGMAASGAVGLFSGVMITAFRMPPFVVTLAMMWSMRGLTNILARGQSIHQVPESYIWLGRGADLFTIPNTVLLMLILYAAAHVLMTRMTLGRYIYAVGGNQEAARLAGVPVRGVLVFAYTICGLLAGLGGVILASQQKSAEPSYGQTYELSVIAAVVVGGTSLSGGEGRIFGTLIGAFIIAVIQNGMNMMGLGAFPQMVVFGIVILAAVLLDRLKHSGSSKQAA